MNDTLSKCRVERLARYRPVPGSIFNTPFKDQPTHEVMAPEGFRFSDGDANDPYAGLHALICFGMADVRERTSQTELEPCPPDCACKG